MQDGATQGRLALLYQTTSWGNMGIICFTVYLHVASPAVFAQLFNKKHPQVQNVCTSSTLYIYVHLCSMDLNSEIKLSYLVLSYLILSYLINIVRKPRSHHADSILYRCGSLVSDHVGWCFASRVRRCCS